MKTTNTLRVSQLVALLAGVAVVGGCGDKSMSPVASNPMPPPPTVTPTVPNTAGASSAAFVAYLKSLPTADDTSEPLLINGDFPVIAEGTDEPAAL